jgi:hypothetical protein
MKSTLFWDLMPCSPLKVNRRFGGTWLPYSDSRNKPARNQSEVRWQAEFLHGLFFDIEDGGDMFLRNVGLLPEDHTALYPRR